MLCERKAPDRNLSLKKDFDIAHPLELSEPVLSRSSQKAGGHRGSWVAGRAGLKARQQGFPQNTCFNPLLEEQKGWKLMNNLAFVFLSYSWKRILVWDAGRGGLLLWVGRPDYRSVPGSKAPEWRWGRWWGSVDWALNFSLRRNPQKIIFSIL